MAEDWHGPPRTPLWGPESSDDAVPDSPGYYAIFVDRAESLPEYFCERLQERGTCLLYLGIASVSLKKRLLRQDLQGRGHSTFFRSMGAVLGMRPEPGSLAGKRNRNNFVFNSKDTRTLRVWSAEHLSASWRLEPQPSADIEKQCILELQPLMNIKHNPSADSQLIGSREECLRISQGGKVDGADHASGGITGFRVLDKDGGLILADAFGNNVAFRCVSCGGPVLAIVREHQRGASAANPASCPACGSQYWLSVNRPIRILNLHRLPVRES